MKANSNSANAILLEAHGLINGDRKEAYGDYYEEAQRIAMLWSDIFGTSINPHHVPLAMVALKLNRERHKHKRDNIVDAIGYLALYQDLMDRGTSPEVKK